jgi:hypothetical protein
MSDLKKVESETRLELEQDESYLHYPEQGICKLIHPMYNKIFEEKCRVHNGRFDETTNAWVFDDINEDQIQHLDWLYNSELVDVKIIANEKLVGKGDGIYFLGYPLARAAGHDSGAVLCDSVSLVKGSIGSGGSQKEWETIVESHSVFQLEIPHHLLRKYSLDSDLHYQPDIHSFHVLSPTLRMGHFMS